MTSERTVLALCLAAVIAGCGSPSEGGTGAGAPAGAGAGSGTGTGGAGAGGSGAGAGASGQGGFGTIEGVPGVWEPVLSWPRDTKPIGGEALVVDPVRNSDFYFFYEADTPNAGGMRHVLKSTDYGATWERVDKTESRGNAWGVAIDPNPLRDADTPPTLYTPAGYGDLGVWKSTDGGVNWVNLFAGGGTVPKKGGGTVTFPPDKNGGNLDFYQVHVLPDDPPNHILVTYHYGTDGTQALGESTDGGQTWEVHNVPWGDSHYVYAVDATTWILVAGWGGPGTYRTTTAGRNANGQISESAWTKVDDMTHSHGSFTPWYDAANQHLYFPCEGVFPLQGIRRTSDGGATWDNVYETTPVGMLVGTKDWLYAGRLGSATILRSAVAATLELSPMRPVEGFLGNVPPYGVASSFDGERWVILAATYMRDDANGEIWRYVEP
jgi:hypothetical protein